MRSSATKEIIPAHDDKSFAVFNDLLFLGCHEIVLGDLCGSPGKLELSAGSENYILKEGMLQA
jgi:hypothetical protein